MKISELLKNFFVKIFGGDRVDYVSGTEALPLPYSPDEEQELLSEMMEGNDEAGQNLIEHNLRLVV